MLQPDRHWRQFCEALGLTELIEDPRFATAPVRFQHCRELIALLDPIFASHTLAEWAEILDRADCYWGRVQTVEEVASDPQAEAIGAYATVGLPDGREIRVVNSPVGFAGTPAAVRGSAPELGQHTEEVLLEAGYGWGDIARLKDRGVLG
jgi:formyl-CoA transferase